MAHHLAFQTHQHSSRRTPALPSFAALPGRPPATSCWSHLGERKQRPWRRWMRNLTAFWNRSSSWFAGCAWTPRCRSSRRRSAKSLWLCPPYCMSAEFLQWWRWGKKLCGCDLQCPPASITTSHPHSFRQYREKYYLRPRCPHYWATTRSKIQISRCRPSCPLCLFRSFAEK